MKKATWLILLLLTQAAFAGDYFQQQVDYRISAQLFPPENKVVGNEEIVYHNNSTAPLDTLYFHLYLNAFRPGSNFDNELKRRGSYYLEDMPPQLYGKIEIDEIKINNQKVDNYFIDDTIMRLPLAKAIKPGDSLAVYFKFESIIPARGYRLGRRGNHYDIGQWYPKVAVYDNYGWHINQFQSMSEQYADFGSYDIRIAAPQDYIIAGCGSLLNELQVYGGNLPVPEDGEMIFDLLSQVEEVGQTGYDDLFDHIILELPFRKLINYSADDIRTWIFHADNVHDFAFSAAPDYMVDRSNASGVIIDSYYKKYHAKNWSPRAIYTAVEAMNYYSELVGPYPYDHFNLVAATVFGGIEYPSLSMVIMYGGRDTDDHGFENVIAHELAHNWFFGAIASNQAEQAFIDEGFTTYLTTRFIEHKYGRYHNYYNYESNLKNSLVPTGDYRNEIFKDYLNGVYSGSEERSNQPANMFPSMDTYRRATYDKSATMVYHLQYILGEAKFNRFLHELYKRYKFKHVYLNDIEKLATDIYGGNLRYFFNQWYNSTDYLDFGFNGVKSRLISKDGVIWYETEFKLKNYGRAISPLDIVVGFETGEIDTVRVPEIVWADGRREYTQKVDLPLKPVHAELNPGGMIPDINRLNNNWRWPKFRFQFDTPKFIYKDSYIEHYPRAYTIAHQPKIWYNEVDGIKLGYGINGSYMGKIHELQLDSKVGTLNGRVDYNFAYADILTMKTPSLKYKIHSSEYDGRGRQSFSIDYIRPERRENSSLGLTLSLNRLYLYDENYLSDKNSWQHGEINTFEFSLDRAISYHKIAAGYSAHLMSAAPGSAYRFTRLTLSLGFAAEFIGKTRLKARVMHGFSDGDVPSSHMFTIAEASPFVYYTNPWFSGRGTLPENWRDEHHLFIDDGVSMPGYLNQNKAGLKKLAVRVELELTNLIKFLDLPRGFIMSELAKISTNVYANNGAVWNEAGFPGTDDFQAEAGLHFSYKVPLWDRFFGDEKLHLYVPFLLSEPPGDDDNFKLRWILSIAG